MFVYLSDYWLHTVILSLIKLEGQSKALNYKFAIWRNDARNIVFNSVRKISTIRVDLCWHRFYSLARERELCYLLTTNLQTRY